MTRRTRRSLRILSALLLAVCAGGTLRGQSMQLGFGGGYEFGLPLALERRPGIIDWCDCNGQGTSFNHAAVWGVEFAMPTLFGDRSGFAMRIGVGSSTGRFTSLPYEGEARPPAPGSFTPIIPISRFVVRSSATMLLFDLQATYHSDDRLRIALGPWVGLRTSTEITQTEEILSPASDTASRVIAEGEELGSPPLTGGFGLGVSYAIPIIRGAAIVPQLYTRADVPALLNNLGIRALTFGGGFTLTIDLSNTDRDIPVSPPLPLVDRPDTPVAPRVSSRLNASIDLYCVGENRPRMQTAMIRAEDVLHRQQMAMLPTIFFDEGSADLPARYERLDAAAAGRFTIDSLARLDPFHLYYHGLNVIGHRMRVDRRAHLTLTGCHARDEAPTLARARAESIRRYLVETWGIESARVRVVSKGPRALAGCESDRCVLLTTSSTALLAPLVTEWVERSFTTPMVGLEPKIQSDAGVKRWSIVIKRNGEVIGRSSSGPNGGELDLALDVGSGGTEPLVAELEVEDSLGTITTARDILPIAIDRAEDQSYGRRGRRERLHYVIYGSAGKSSASTRPLLRQIAANAREGGRVAVTALASSSDDARDTSMVAELRALLKGRDVVVDARLDRSTSNLVNHTSGLPERELLGAGLRVTVER